MKRHILRAELEAMREDGNAAFVAKLTPNIDPSSILGVRVPLLRKLAKQIIREGNADAFLNDVPHRYLEENQIHAFVLNEITDYDKCMEKLEAFLPYVKCWNVTDAIRPKIIAKHTEETKPVLYAWLRSEEPYIVRTAIGLFMAYYLEDAFETEQAERIADLRFDHYYVRMMAAWYMATALAKQPDAVLPLLEENRMDIWTHNKTIQKAVESFRIPEAQKTYLKTMRRKEGQ